MTEPRLAIIIPCYNEQEALPYTIERLQAVLRELTATKFVSDLSFLLFVDDGSTDKTWEIISYANEHCPKEIKGIKFTRNFSNQNAIIAGLETARNLDVDCALTIDADLQQDETRIKDFILAYKNGADIVCGVRKDRKTDAVFKKIPSLLFYKFMNLSGIAIKPNHSEYRLVSKKTLQILSNYRETNMFLRGLFYDLGLKTEYVYFDVKKRLFGKTKFSFISLLRLAAYGIVSFSVRPLRLVFLTGFIISFVSFIFGMIGAYGLIFNKTFNNYGIQLFEVLETFMAGLQILCIGIIGEYVGQILQEVKARPRYIKDQELL